MGLHKMVNGCWVSPVGVKDPWPEGNHQRLAYLESGCLQTGDERMDSLHKRSATLRHGRVMDMEERCESPTTSLGNSIRLGKLDRSASTVARELKRNGSRTLGYLTPMSMRTRLFSSIPGDWQGSRLERDRGLRTGICRLKQGWSPEQVAGLLESGKRVIHGESCSYWTDGSEEDYGWRHYLPRAKSKRGWRGQRGSPASFMAMRRPIAGVPRGC